MQKLTDIAIGNSEARILTAQIGKNGDLEFVGHESLELQDIGDEASRYAGELDYVRSVPAEFKDTLLLHLLKERFDSETEFGAWLNEKGLPSKLN